MGPSARQLGRKLLPLAGVGILYWVTARLSLNLALVHGQVAPIWPPTGIALVAILVIGRQVWPAIAIAALVVNLPLGPSPLGAAVIAAGNTLAPLASAQMLRWAGFRLELDRVRDALAITFLAALGGMTISASVGSAVLLLAGSTTTSGVAATWAVWWAGDAMGVLLVAPFLLSLLPQSSRGPLTPWRAVELGAILLATGVGSYLLLQDNLRLEYLVFPLIMLAAWRFRLRGAAPAALIASGVAAGLAVHGSGPFETETLFQKMVTLQAFNVCVALSSFILASFVDNQEQAEALRHRLRSAEIANEAKSAFLNLAAHELRTPLTVINGYLSMLADGTFGPTPVTWFEPLHVLVAKVRELDKHVTDLIQAARLDSEFLPLRPVRVDLRVIAEDAVERARAHAELLGAEIGAGIPAAAIPVDADPEQIGRILDNLLHNGLTYTSRPPRLSLTVSDEDEQALVRVIDNGFGVPDGERELIFDRFQKSSSPQLNNLGGTGLGLYISRRVAIAHGETLGVEHSHDDGSVFVLALPLARGSSPEPALASAD